MDETSVTYVESKLDALRLVEALRIQGFTKSYYIDQETGERVEFKLMVINGILQILLVTSPGASG